MPSEVTATSPLVVQHNALVNARFSLTTLETRLFIAMLRRIGREDTALPVCRIPVRELCPDSAANSIYADVREMVRNIVGRSVVLEVLGPGGTRLKQPQLLGRPLMGRADYLPEQGMVEAEFNEHLRPYLLELTGNFTKAQLEHLLKIKGAVSHRIYWLLREYATFGKRTVGVDELRSILGFTDEYAGRFDMFRVRVLDRAQQELAHTDLPFTYELIKSGRAVTEIRFLFAPAAGQLAAPAPDSEGWEAALLAVGIDRKSLTSVRTQVEAGYYDEGYIRFVLTRVRAQVQAGKVKKEAGAVYKALTDGYLLAEYRQPSPTPAGASKAGPKKSTPAALAKQRQKLENELTDARNSLQFVQMHPGYSPEQRRQAVADVEAHISQVQAQLVVLDK